MAVIETGKDGNVQVSVNILQIVSSIVFFFQACYIILINTGVLLSRIQEMATERRLTMACYIMALVSIISCSTNVFQISELDDVKVSHADNYVLDLCRPIEWICTCPFMQLALVISGGVKIPSSRMILMPALTALMLLLGLPASLSETQSVRVASYCLSFCVMMVLFYFNRQQILEVTNGEEGIVWGKSRFKKATVALMVTWLPFPIAYALSPEGLGVIADPMTVHIGWGVLNVLAKATYTLYVQRSKDVYMKELRGKSAAGSAWRNWICEGRKRYEVDDDVDVEFIANDVLTFLGIKHKTNDLLTMLKNANVTNTKELDALDEVACQESLLPLEVIYVMQQRLRSYRYGFAEQGARGQANSTLTYTIAGTRGQEGSQAAEKLRGAMESARMVGADKGLLELASQRVEELYAWHAIQTHIIRQIVTTMEKDDEPALRDILNVAEMAGLAKEVTLGKAKLAEKDVKRKKSAEYVQIGNQYVRQKKYQEAIDAYDEAISCVPKDAKTLLNRANCHRIQGDWGAAEEDVRMSLELRPTNAQAWRCRALVLQRMEQYQDAFAACQKGLAINPKDQIMLKVMAAVQLGKSYIDEAPSEFGGMSIASGFNTPQMSPRATNDFPAPTATQIGNDSSNDEVGPRLDSKKTAPTNPMFFVPPVRKFDM